MAAELVAAGQVAYDVGGLASLSCDVDYIRDTDVSAGASIILWSDMLNVAVSSDTSNEPQHGIGTCLGLHIARIPQEGLVELGMLY